MTLYRGKNSSVDNNVISKVNEVFGKLSELIAKKEIWNPTLAEFHSFSQPLNNSEIFLEDGSYTLNNSEIPIRTIQ